MNSVEQSLTRIGVFYDGGFFSHISNYYLYQHDRKARISISGLHQFIRNEVARQEGVDMKYCQIVDAHYFRGRLSAMQAKERGEDFLLHERRWDEILMREGVVTHYLPMGAEGEKGIDVWLALEAFELAVYKRFSVSVLVAGDGDYVPLVRKLNTVGTRVMLLAWDFEYADPAGRKYVTKTSQGLINEVTYPVMMSDEIESRGRKKDAAISGLFVPRRDDPAAPGARPLLPADASVGEKVPAPEAGMTASAPLDGAQRGTIMSLFEGYGFVKPEDGRAGLFFHRSTLQGALFSSLREGDQVEFTEGTNDRGPCATAVRLVE